MGWWKSSAVALQSKIDSIRASIPASIQAQATTWRQRRAGKAAAGRPTVPPNPATPTDPPRRSRRSRRPAPTPSSPAGRPWTHLSFWRERASKGRDRLLAALTFYTCIPWVGDRQLDWSGVARLAPWVGGLIGLGLAAIDLGLGLLGWPVLTRSVLVVLAWLAVTGGLHLDGAIDTADGLAVRDPARRLAVMAESRIGAFGALAAVAVLLLKTAALADLAAGRGWVLVGAAVWGRWGQLVAIFCYPYLRPKAQIHDGAVRSPWELLPGLGLGVAVSLLWVAIAPAQWLAAAGLALGGSAIAILSGAWFDRQLGGQTGDSYGAIVEWTEAIVLALLCALVTRAA